MVGRTPEYLGKKLGRRGDHRRGGLDPRHADAGPARRGPGDRAPRHDQRHEQRRVARLLRSALRLRLGGEQQRQRVRGHHGDQRLLPVHTGRLHAARPVRADPRRAGAGRLAGEAAPRRRRCGHPADQRPAVRRSSSAARSSSSPPSPSSRLWLWARSWRRSHDDHARTAPGPGGGGGRLRTPPAVGLAARRPAQARPPRAAAQPRHVRRVGGLGARHDLGDRRAERVRRPHRGLAVVHGALRQPRRSRRGGPGQGPGRVAAAHKKETVRAQARRRGRGRGRRHRADHRRPRGRRGGRDDPGRRRRRRGHRDRRRVGDHRRVGAGRPRGGRRPQLGHRRHHRAVRPHRREDHDEAGRVVRRPHDRAGRGRGPAEDAQRDRADDPAGRAHDHLPARRGGVAADERLRRAAAVVGRAHRAAGLPHPDDHRRAALRDRHRRDGPARAAQRARHVRPRGGGRG